MAPPNYPIDSLLPLIRRLRADKVPGDFIELGVLAGQTLIPLGYIAECMGRKCYGVDSFRGMGEPTKEDGKRGAELYHKGRFDQKGAAYILARVERAGLKETVEIWEGFVPAVLSVRTPNFTFALAHLDLDTYAPTKAALAWTWPKVVPGGYLAVHDSATLNRSVLAARATTEFAKEHEREMSSCGVSGITVWFRKGL